MGTINFAHEDSEDTEDKFFSDKFIADVKSVSKKGLKVGLYVAAAAAPVLLVTYGITAIWGLIHKG